MMILSQALQYLYPDADLDADIIVADDGDGIAYIHTWNMPGPRPSETVIEAAWWEVLQRQSEEDVAMMVTEEKAQDAKDFHEVIKEEIWTPEETIKIIKGLLDRLDYLEIT